ncbi:MAG: FHA domain-containing serine/threonine-protein kinase [Planctomycetota bacterium]
MKSENTGLLVFFDNTREITIPIDKPQFLIGRALHADIRILDDKQVSREHCRIVRLDDGCVIEDMQSSNGTFLNGNKVAGKHKLKYEDIIKVGARQVVFREDRRRTGGPTEAPHVDGVCAQCLGVISGQEIAAGQVEYKGKGFLCLECSADKSRVHTYFNNYEIQKKIAQGGMGVVYKAKHRILGTVVALKMIRAGQDQNTEAIKRFLREIRLGARVVHNNIVRFLDAGQDKGIHYAIMEYCEGISLGDKLSDGVQQTKLAADIAGQLFDAVQAIHNADLVHRDIKPANVILMKDNVVKLIDFGLVKELNEENASIITGTGIGLGSPWYIAPEQFKQSRNADRRADIYSLGATLYHVVCGRPPIMGETHKEFFRQMAEFKVNHPCQLNSELSQATGDWLMGALTQDPDKRYQTVKEFRKAARK